MLNRAYALLNVKAFDASGRRFSGMATTPEPDRVGDVIEPLGVRFKNPLPLLLFHDHHLPVGTVKFGKPTKNGVEFEATIPEVDEPGALKSRTDEAAQMVKYGLIRAVSIGFRPIRDAIESIKNGGLRFLETEVLELSLVPVPANADATIVSVKSLDSSVLAASGTGTDESARNTNLPGVTGAQPVRLARKGAAPMAKTISEQITAFEAKRAAHFARMNEIQTKAADENRTKEESEKEEFDGLKVELKQIDDELVDLREMEVANKAAAKPIVAATADEASRSRAPQHAITVKDNLAPGIEFSRYVMCLAASRGNTLGAMEIAKHRFPDQPRIQTVLKAAVAAGTTTDPTWAGNLVDYTNFAGDFVEYLRPQTIIGRFGTAGIPSLTPVPFNIRVMGQTSGGQGYWVGQGKLKPLTKFDFAPATLGFSKVANIAVLTDELVRFSSPSAEQLVRKSLADALIARMDIDFIDPAKAAVANVSPASITNGITPIQSSGTDAADIKRDMQALLGAFIANNISPTSLVLLMSNSTALALSLMTNALGQSEFPNITMTGGTLLGFPVITSQYLSDGSPTGGIVVAVNASDIYLADDGQVVVDASREASLEMSDDPENETGTIVSMFQANMIALRAERFINWQRRRTGAVAYIDNVQWTSAGSPA